MSQSSSAAPQNRRQRRAQARSNGASPSSTSTPSIPLSRPPPTSRSSETKTLYQLAEELNNNNNNKPSSSQNPSTTISPASLRNPKRYQKTKSRAESNPPYGSEEDEDSSDYDTEDPIGRSGNALVTASTLTMLHFTLDVLVAHQYAMSIEWDGLVWRSGRAFVALFITAYLAHPYLHPASSATKTTPPESSSSPTSPSPSPAATRTPTSPLTPTSHTATQLVLLAISTLASTRIITTAHEEAYYAVMKHAPPLGTLWVWSVLEMRLGFAVASVAVTGAWCVWGGYKMW
ncbi:MAG: hypothetical protein M1819_000351 [Sarea resinae]|nr:MAG: hypothetical protein M1819_000351 [Sarea resinae]